MANSNRRVFSHAPLRSSTDMVLRNPVSMITRDWYETISNNSLMIFDITAIVMFSMIGSLLIVSSAGPLGYGRYSFHMQEIVMWKAAYRFGFALLATTLGVIGIMAGARLRLFEGLEEINLLAPLKLMATALTAWGAFFLYFDPVAGFIPMTGLTLIALMLLFRLELKEALYMGAYLGICGLPIFFMI